MCPNERAIQSRIKEAFGVKVNNSLWDIIMEGFLSIKEPLSLKHEGLSLAGQELHNLSGLYSKTGFEFSYLLQID
jgi:hypothetical protein